MEKLLCKFKVGSVTDFGGDNRESKLTPVVQWGANGNENENASFSKFTPSGEMRLMVNNPDKVDFFKPADEVYIQITKERPVNADQLLDLLTSCFKVGYLQFRKLNLYKVITFKLTEIGIKLFIDENDHVLDLEFLKKQLTDQEYNTAITADVDDEFNIFPSGTPNPFTLKRIV